MGISVDAVVGRMVKTDGDVTFDVMKSLSKATEVIGEASCAEELLASLETSFKAFGFDSFNLGCHKNDKYELALNPTLANWPRSFMIDYEGRHWADFDPTLARAAVAREAFEWSVRDIYPDCRQRDYMEFLLSTPLRGGFAIPLAARKGTVSSISVESHREQKFSPWVPQALMVIANCAVLKAEALGLCRENISIDESVQSHRLSATQLEILKWAAAGKSNGDIALIVNLSERVVKYHMSEILKKLGVATRSQAIARMANERSFNL